MSSPSSQSQPARASRSLSEGEIEQRMKALPQWRVERVESATEIKRSFRFDSFEAAMAFMMSAVEDIAAADHHPRWENVYRDVHVSLNTHSVGNQLSELDFQIAQMLDKRYAAATSKAYS
jgi:4a-hydroxytetrahydrobiopterin dehydratase